MSLNLNFNHHPLDSQLANLDTSPNGSVTRKNLLEIAGDHIERLIHIDMIAAHGIDIFPRQTRVHALQGLFNILESDSHLLFNVWVDIATLVPATLARGFDSVSDADGLRVVEGFRVCLGAGVVEELHGCFIRGFGG